MVKIAARAEYNQDEMKTFDIDALDPGYSSPFKPSRRKKQEPWMKRAGWVRLNGNYFKGPGIDPRKMQDWRALERRHHDLDQMWRVVSCLFWKTIGNLDPPEDGRDRPGLFVVIDPPQQEEVKVLDISRTSYSVNWQDRMLKELMENPDCYGDFRFVPYDGGGREVGHLHHKMERLIRVRGLYCAAFHRAVADRLVKLDESRTISGSRYRYLEPTIFLIENEGRHHVVTSGVDGGFTWHDGEICATALLR